MPVAHHRIRIGGHGAVGHQVIGLVDVHRVDLVVVGELQQVDDLGRLGPDLGDVLVAHHHPAALLELVALDDLGAGDLALALRAPLLLLDAGLALVVQLIERDGRARFGGGIHLHRNGDEADLEIALPGRTRGMECSMDASASGTAIGRRDVQYGSKLPAALAAHTDSRVASSAQVQPWAGVDVDGVLGDLLAQQAAHLAQRTGRAPAAAGPASSGARPRPAWATRRPAIDSPPICP